MKPTWCTFYSIYWELMPLHVSSITCSLSGGAWYIACVLCQLTAPGLEWNRTEGLYMFRASLARPQEALHKLHFVYVYVYVSWLRHGCSLNAPWHCKPEDEQVMLETCRGPWRVPRWFHFYDNKPFHLPSFKIYNLYSVAIGDSRNHKAVNTQFSDKPTQNFDSKILDRLEKSPDLTPKNLCSWHIYSH
jgi:hypothetical protein